jgi:SnoaL-like domain
MTRSTEAILTACLPDFAPEFEFVPTGAVPGAGSRIRAGPDRWRELVDWFWGEFDDAGAEIHELAEAGDNVLAELTLRGRASSPERRPAGTYGTGLSRMGGSYTGRDSRSRGRRGRNEAGLGPLVPGAGEPPRLTFVPRSAGSDGLTAVFVDELDRLHLVRMRSSSLSSSSRSFPSIPSDFAACHDPRRPARPNHRAAPPARGLEPWNCGETDEASRWWWSSGTRLHRPR